jgi:hypothetical protein
MTISELDDLKGAWRALEAKLDRQHALEMHQLRAGRLASARTGLRPLIAGQCVQAGLGVALMAVFGPYVVEHWGQWHVVVYGLCLHLYGLMLTAFAGRDLVSIARIDYAAPVLEIQKRLATLRADRIRSGFAFAVAGCFVWVPLVLVVFESLGADLWRYKPAVVWWWVASGAVAVAITAGLVAWSRRTADARVRRYFEDSAAGRSLTRAEATLAEIARFEEA